MSGWLAPGGSARPVVARRRWALPLLVVALALAGCAQEVEPPEEAGPEPAPAAPAPPPSPVVLPVDHQLAWAPCEGVPEAGVEGPVQCARLKVRVDHAQPASEVIEIALARRPATAGRSEGVIVVNPGGPGASGVDAVASDGGAVPAELRARFDVVGFDPRGSHRSGQVTCVEDEEFLGFLDEVDPTPDDAVEVAEYHEGVVAFEAQCAARHGELLARLGSRFVARDVEALRIALGEEQITWFGYSYGTLLGTVYAQEFPDRVRAMVLDGPVVTGIDPAVQARDDLDGLERTVERFAQDCAARGDRCRLTAHGGALAALEAVIERVRAGGLDGHYEFDGHVGPTGEGGGWPLEEGRLGYGLLVAVYSEETWPELEEALAAVLEQDWGGKLRFLGDVYLSGFSDQPPFTTAGEQTFWALSCADRDKDLEAASVAEGLELERRVLGDPFAGRPAWLSAFRLPNVWCLRGVWPEPAEWLGEAVVDPGWAPPAIAFGATGDFATPIELLAPLAEAVGGAHMVRVEANTHVNMATNACQQRLTVAFVLNPTAPPARAAC